MTDDPKHTPPPPDDDLTTRGGPRGRRRAWFLRLFDPPRAAARLVETHTRAAARAVETQVVPAWQRVTQGEPRLPVSIEVCGAIGLQVILPARVGGHPRWLFPIVAGLLLLGIVIANPTRVDRRAPALRAATLVLTAVLAAANMASAARLITDLVQARGIRDPATLLWTGGAIWLVNVMVFALLYWEFDRGGPAARAMATRAYPDFLFPQMTSPELSPPDWEAGFVDYLYVSFTNATAFSPTDVMPMSKWAKVAMLVQSALSLMLAALVIARAVNVLH